MIKKIFKKEIALKLICFGHILSYTEPNIKKPWLSVFVFENSGSFKLEKPKILQVPS